MRKKRPGYKFGGAQHKRPGRDARQDRQRGSLDRLLEAYPAGTDRPTAIQMHIDTLMKALGMSVQETR